ncbi:MAG: hypothetical protein GC200_11275 [Tepidisphaera sp.]|nr:hypothetical protein [Tepidisphaera sp.]
MVIPGWLVEGQGGSGNASRGLFVRRRRDGLPGYAKVFDVANVAAAMRDTAAARRVIAWAFQTEQTLLSRTRDCSRLITLLDAQPPTRKTPGVLVFERASHSAAALFRQPAPHACAALLDASQALRQLHHRGIVHQDLKAANLLSVVRNAHARWVLADLGRASSADCWGPFAHHWVVGDRAHAPPELLFGAGSRGWRSRGVATDLWLLGALAFELLLGQPLTAWLWAHVPARARPPYPDAPTPDCPGLWAREQPAWARAIRLASDQVRREARIHGCDPASSRSIRDDFLARCAIDWRNRRFAAPRS